MGSGTKKKKGHVDMGHYIYTDAEYEAMYWCISNGITIAPFAASPNSWYLDITIRGKRNRSPDTYDKKMIWKQLFNYYKYYYDKYRR